jgi:Carboxypeptidase regulatory-like domain
MRHKNTSWMIWLGAGVLFWGFGDAARAQSTTGPGETAAESAVAGAAQLEKESVRGLLAPDADPQQAGRINGRIVDQSGVAVAGARLRLVRDNQAVQAETLSGDDGQFSFVNVAPGTFHLRIAAANFATRDFSGSLRPGEAYTIPQITLAIAEVMTEVRVVPTQVEVAQEQIKTQEKQRALGLIPNFYVSYVNDAAPLTTKQKFDLAWKTTVDPVTFGITGIIASVEQSQNTFSGYGQGAQGYAKRFGAAYASGATNTFIGSAILPSLLKQDPRYFYKGTGSKHSRVLYAIANSVICKGDNGRWQPNYSSVLGGLAAGGISNLYYPAKDRNGVGLTFENALIGTAATAATNLLQEFLIRKLTPNVPNNDPGTVGKGARPIAKMVGYFLHEGD